MNAATHALGPIFSFGGNIDDDDDDDDDVEK